MEEKTNNVKSGSCAKACEYRRTIIWTIVCTSISTLFFWLVIFQWVSGPNFSSFSSLVDKYVLNTEPQITEPYALYMIGQLVRDGTIISLKDFWSFESNFYQSFITILIALIGVLGVAAYLVVKHSSEDTARNIARSTMRDEISRELSSQDFHEKVSKNIKDCLEPVEIDLEDKFSNIGTIADSVDGLIQQLTDVTEQNHELKNSLRHVVARLAVLDKEEEAGRELHLKMKDGEK